MRLIAIILTLSTLSGCTCSPTWFTSCGHRPGTPRQVARPPGPVIAQYIENGRMIVTIDAGKLDEGEYLVTAETKEPKVVYGMATLAIGPRSRGRLTVTLQPVDERVPPHWAVVVVERSGALPD